MEIIRITSVGDKFFEPVWKIFTESFPLFERRTIGQQETAFRSEYYRMECYLDRRRVVGFTAYWDFPGYLYIEYFAVDAALRSGGYGGKILKPLLENAGKPIIIEIDPQVDETSMRRLRFYERLGFARNPFAHPAYIYQPEHHIDTPMTILTYPAAITREMYERFDSDMRGIVLKRD